MTNDDLAAGAPTEHHAGAVIAFKADIRETHPAVMFFREVHGRRLTHLARKRVPVRSGSTEILGEFETLLECSHHEDWLLRHENQEITLIAVTEGWATVDSASDDYDLAHKRSARVIR
jgi:hypothetical protein